MGDPPLSPAPRSLRPGDRMAEKVVGPLTRTDFVRYAGAGGDFNPIHHDEEFARAAGLPSVFGMGMLHAGILGVAVARWVGPECLRTFGVRFAGQVWPGDVLTFTGSVDGVRVEDGTPIASLTLEARRGSDEVVLTGTATAAVASA